MTKIRITYTIPSGDNMLAFYELPDEIDRRTGKPKKGVVALPKGTKVTPEAVLARLGQVGAEADESTEAEMETMKARKQKTRPKTEADP